MVIRLSAILALTFAATLHAAAAEIPSKLDANQLASIKSIGVISAIGDSLNLATNSPFLRLSMSQKSRPISDLGLDDALTTFVGQKLSARFQVEPVEFDRAKFSAVQEPGFLKTLSLPPIHDLVQNLTAPVDAYLVISKDLVAYGLNDDILRPGLNIGRGGFHEDEYEANAFIMLSVFDAHTHALLAMIDYPPPISHFWGGKVETLPLDGALWPDNDGNFTQPQLDKLKTLFSDDLDGIVSKSMEQLGLLPQQ